MRYEIRNAEGRVCCASDNIDRLCDKCKAKAQFAGPDPYARGRAAERSATEDPNYQPYGTPPDPYRLALARRKEAR